MFATPGFLEFLLIVFGCFFLFILPSLADRYDLDALSRRVRGLEAEIDRLKRTQGPTRQ